MKVANRPAQGRPIVRWDQASARVASQVVSDRARFGGDDRQRARLGLEEHGWQAVCRAGWHYDGVARLKKSFLSLAGDPPFEGCVDSQALRESAKLPAFRSVPGDPNADALWKHGKGVKKVVEPLDWH
jgi:hypothetical protein